MAGAARRSRTFSASQRLPGAETIRLEQNYRSTSNILSAAQRLIENNNGRLGKKLWTDSADGGRFFAVLRLPTSRRSAAFCVRTELKPGRRTARWSNAPFSIAVTPSRACWKSPPAGPACRTVSTAACCQRQEIKNALSYLRLIANRNDGAAFE